MIEVGLPCWNVLIVEDDVEIGDLHRRIVDATPRFDTIQVVRNGRLALERLHQIPVDLTILDLAMPGGDGIGFLRQVRSDGNDVEVIVVTASHDSETVRQVVHLGVLDYVIKPFPPERLRQALEAFARRVRALDRPQISQADFDLIQAGGTMRRLPKGLRPATLELVERALRESPSGFSAAGLSRAVGVSRVTARRYLEYLDVIGAARVDEVCGKLGRPVHRYRWRTVGVA